MFLGDDDFVSCVDGVGLVGLVVVGRSGSGVWSKISGSGEESGISAGRSRVHGLTAAFRNG